MTHAVVLVPGIMGSELWLGDDLIWPGAVATYLAQRLFPYDRMRELLRPDLEARDVIRRYSISVQYQALIDDLGRCGFHLEPSQGAPTLYLFPYDWRKANESAAQGLAQRLERIVRDHAGQVEVSLVAHSMGGLVCRYYLESGRFANRPGFGTIRRLLTIGTPHRGAARALPLLLGMEKQLWLSKDQVQLMCREPSFPAGYQLLPPPGEPFAWNEDTGAELGALDVYDTTAALELGLVPQNLQAARLFHAALDPSRRPAHVRYFCFAGTRQRTASLVRVRSQVKPFRVRSVELESGGDGTVPGWSSTLPGVQNLPVGGEHSVLYKARDLRTTLAALLGAPGVLAGVTEEVEVALREHVSEPESAVHATLTLGGGTEELEGELRVERAEAGANGDVVFRSIKVYPIHYQGLRADMFEVSFLAPELTGPYRVAYYPAGRLAPAGNDELFVQEPPMVP